MAAAMAGIAVAMAGTVANMPQPPMAGEDTLAMVFTAGVVIIVLGARAAMRAMEGADFTGLEAAGGEVNMDIRTMDIPGSAITPRAMATRTTGLTVTAPVGTMIRITDIIPTDTIPIDTDTGRP